MLSRTPIVVTVVGISDCATGFMANIIVVVGMDVFAVVLVFDVNSSLVVVVIDDFVVFVDTVDAFSVGFLVYLVL